MADDFIPSDAWIKIGTPPDFRTHANYVKCLSELSKNLSLSIDGSTTTSLVKPTTLDKKIKLLLLTKENIEEEYSKIKAFNDYSQICVSWIPVKSYYLFFNLILIFIYLYTGDEDNFNVSHSKLHAKLKDFIMGRKLLFNMEIFNNIFTSTQIMSWKFKSGSNLKLIDKDNKLLAKQVVKKLFKYKKEECKRIKGIRSLREPKKGRFMKETTVNLCEFFYIYRLKANYRDMEFINSGVSIPDFYYFYEDYYLLSTNFYEAFKPHINLLAKERLGKRIV